MTKTIIQGIKLLPLFLTFNFTLLTFFAAFSQSGAAINTTGAAADGSAAFEVSSTAGGILIPRMTTNERDNISNPANGLQIYNLDCNNFQYFNGSSWVAVNPIVANVNIGASPGGAVCSGTSVTYTATPINGGASPTFQWKLNGVDVGTNSDTYTNSTLNNGDQISCELTSNAACVTGNPAISNVLTMIVAAPPTVADAGTDINPAYGVTIATLAANTPSVGIGAWSVVSGAATITNPTLPASGVTGLAMPGAATLRWTISNSPCADSYDDVVITTYSWSCNIGDSKEGGIVFYHDAANNKCYVSATSDQSSGAQWGCYGTIISGTSTAIGTGPANTTHIDNNCTTSGIAAEICENLSLGGYSDWFLPSKDELYEMYNNTSTIGGFSSDIYWSSSEIGSSGAYRLSFYGAVFPNSAKNNTFRVRCIRRY